MVAPLHYLPNMDGIKHGFFTREGGVSTGDYTSLNCRLASQDKKENIEENRSLVSAYFGLKSKQLLTLQQIHSPTALIVEQPWSDENLPQADGLVTNKKGIILGALTADCGSVLFADPKAKVIGAAHSGWKGAVGGILEQTLKQMVSLGASLEHIHVALGPTISQKNYEVSAEFKDNLLSLDPKNDQFFNALNEHQKPHFDLPAYIKKRLVNANINHLFISSECTYGNESKYFSYRYNTHNGQNDYGCQISAISLI